MNAPRKDIAVLQNAAELGMLAGETSYEPNELNYDGINDWIVSNAIEFDRLYPAGTFDDLGHYYTSIREWGELRMRTGE